MPPHGLDLANHVQLDYAKGSPERAELTQTLQKLKRQMPFKIPLTIDGSTVGSPSYNRTQLTA